MVNFSKDKENDDNKDKGERGKAIESKRKIQSQNRKHIFVLFILLS